MEQPRPPSFFEIFLPKSLYRPVILRGNGLDQCELNGFLELESMDSLKSKLSKTSSWYEMFQQHAQQAELLDTTGNHVVAEVLYHQCKAYLERAAEGVDPDRTAVEKCEHSSLALALCWVYLALANLYRSSLSDYWKATECLISLFSAMSENPTASSSSQGLNEIRFALCLTVFEWADELEDRDHKPEVLLLALEEARDLVEEWDDLDDVEVGCLLAEKLMRGYAKVRIESRASYWFHIFLQLTVFGIRTGDEFLDSSIHICYSEPFQNLPEDKQKKMKICMKIVREFGTKAKLAGAAGHTLEAVECYKRCEAAVVQAGAALPTSRRAIMLQWVYERLGHVYWFDIVDLVKAAEYFGACLLATVAITELFVDQTTGGTNLEVHKRNICFGRITLVEIMYERAHDMDDEDQKGKDQLIAEAISVARNEFHLTNPDGSEVSDVDQIEMASKIMKSPRTS